MRIKQDNGKRKNEFSAMKIFDFGEKSKQRSQKSVRKIGKRTKGQRKTLTEHFFLQ